MYLDYYTNNNKQSVMQLLIALATMVQDWDIVSNHVDDSVSGISEKYIDNFVIAALDNVGSVVELALLPDTLNWKCFVHFSIPPPPFIAILFNHTRN